MTTRAVVEAEAGDTTAQRSLPHKASWVTRRIPPGTPIEWAPVESEPQTGDVLLCTIDEVGLHGRLETASGQRSRLFRGDRVLCALGGRYATSILEAVPTIGEGRADLVSASGLCGRVLDRADKTTRPTTLQVEAQAFLAGVPVNVSQFALEPPATPVSEPGWILVVGSAMDSGKTTACVSLIHGLSRAGFRVGAAKLTGTASARDLHSYRDAGADPVVDFLDCGWPSTAGCRTDELLEIVDRIVGTLRAADVDAVVLEVADGLLQPETAALLAHIRERLSSPGVVYTARESMAGVAGATWLADLGYRVGAVSGVVTSSPLACREVEHGIGVPCIPTRELAEKSISLLQAGSPVGTL
jgi:hypothetical protein